MTTYSFVQYDVLKDLVYFKGTPTPGLVDTINENKNDISSIRDIIQNDTTGQLDLLPPDAAQDIKNFLITVPEINLADSKYITLTIAIIDDTEIGNVNVVSKNLDGTKTYVTKGGASLIISIDILKPKPKWKTMGKCRNCLKFTFDEDNDFNFTGNIGGTWDSSFRNGQKVYSIDIPTFPTTTSPAVYTNYRIFWKPNVTYSGLDYNGNAINIVNTHKWICVPSASIGTPTELSNTTFFHVLNNFSASCPYADPTATWYNFFGNDGYFLLDNTTLPTIQTSTQNAPCPTFNPTPGITDWGYNCGPNGCVASPSGSIGTYNTIGACELNCSITSSVSYGYNCTPNGCVLGNILNTGSYNTLAECELACIVPTEPTNCSCDETNLITNGNFSSGEYDWVYSPTSFTPGIGSWNLSTGLAIAAVAVTMSANGSSSLMSLTQANVFQPSCSYNICLQAWTNATSPSTNLFLSQGPNFPLIGGNITPIPTAYNFTLNNSSVTDLTFYLALEATGSAARVFIDNICVTLLSCPPQEPGDCTISGSIYNYEEVEYDCLCPEGYTPDGNGNCITTAQPMLPISTPTSSYNGTYAPNIYAWNGGIGYSLLQPPLQDNYYFNIVPALPVLILGNASLYYQYNFNGSGNSSTGNPSPIFGNPNIYKTQYTFDILKSCFFSDPPATGNNPIIFNPNSLPLWNGSPVSSGYPYNPLPADPLNNWITKRVRYVPPNTYLQAMWYGCGTAVEISPTTKTYHILITAARQYKIKLNGVTLLTTGTGQAVQNSFPFSNTLSKPNQTHPTQQYVLGVFGGVFTNIGTIPSPIYGYNPYINSPISGNLGWLQVSDFTVNYFVPPGGGVSGTNYQSLGSVWYGGKANPCIYPITIPSGSCGLINVEVRPGNSCDEDAWVVAALFDNTAVEIANATSINDLNIIWDTSYLPDLRTLPNNVTNFPTMGGNLLPPQRPLYFYGYLPLEEPSPLSYIPVCPSGSVPISGSACNGCTSLFQITSSIPCGGCIECTQGKLYNGYVVDKGGYMFQGRGPGGIINTGSINASTWVIPAESDWDVLITYANSGIAPPTIIGSLGTTAGGKLKDYTRDLNATCWENPNIGAQTATGSSGWAGTAGGKRDNLGVYSGLGFDGYWWSANSSSVFPNPFQLYTRELKHLSSDVYRNIYPKNNGFSLRLVRPAIAGEINGTTIVGAYTGKDGTIYDGIVIGTQVWINKNLSETQYNNGSIISLTINPTTWGNAINSPTTASSCFYNNDFNNEVILSGNIDPLTGECYTLPNYYVYQKCGTNQYLIQTVSGSTITPGETQKDSNQDCWEFTNISTGIPNYLNQTLHAGNYFSGSNTVYDTCDECTAIHTMYMTFKTKNC